MLKTLERFWPIITVLLLIALLAGMFFFPAGIRLLAWIVLILSTGITIAFVVRRWLEAYRQGRLERSKLVRSILLDVAGILLAILAAVLVARKAAPYVGQLAGTAAESAWPGTGVAVGILAGILSAVLVGMGMGLLVRWIWGSLTRPKGSSPAR